MDFERFLLPVSFPGLLVTAHAEETRRQLHRRLQS